MLGTEVLVFLRCFAAKVLSIYIDISGFGCLWLPVSDWYIFCSSLDLRR